MAILFCINISTFQYYCDRPRSTPSGRQHNILKSSVSSVKANKDIKGNTNLSPVFIGVLTACRASKFSVYAASLALATLSVNPASAQN